MRGSTAHSKLKSRMGIPSQTRLIASAGSVPGAMSTIWSGPNQALNFATPATRYQISVRPFPEALPPIQYGSDDHVRRLQDHGVISFQGKPYRVGKAFSLCLSQSGPQP